MLVNPTFVPKANKFHYKPRLDYTHGPREKFIQVNKIFNYIFHLDFEEIYL